MPTTSWTILKEPIIGLAPMDGITDTAFREIVDIYGKPDIFITEFVPVEGIAHGVLRLMPTLRKHKTKTPIIAQFFGIDLRSFYKSTLIAAALGFDGIDINMGCPDNNIMKKGGGGGLIGQPELAKQIIKTVKKALIDWRDGVKLSTAHVPEQIINWIEKENKNTIINRNMLPVSIKTRTGLDVHNTKKWISTILETQPDAITLHGRTLLQMYRGKADWGEIAKASELTKKTKTILLGNGDVVSVDDAKKRAKTYRLQGILVGRHALGNPWLFSSHVPTIAERFDVMIKHSNLFLKYRPELKLYPMRKHLAWYCTGFTGSRSMRDKLMHVVTIEDVKRIISQSGFVTG